MESHLDTCVFTAYNFTMPGEMPTSEAFSQMGSGPEQAPLPLVLKKTVLGASFPCPLAMEDVRKFHLVPLG